MRIDVETVNEVEYVAEDGRRRVAPPKTSINVHVDAAAELELAGAVKRTGNKAGAAVSEKPTAEAPRFKRPHRGNSR